MFPYEALIDGFFHRDCLQDQAFRTVLVCEEEEVC